MTWQAENVTDGDRGACSVSEANHCPQCGSVLPGDAPAGMCPECLLRQGLESGGFSASKTPTVVGGGFVPPSPEEVARCFPQLQVLELLGKGGMGAVYKVRQPALDRVVALKVLPPEVGKDPAFAERFAREARALARLSHQNIVAVYDFGRTSAPSPRPSPPGAGEREEEGLYYFVMEYVEGVNLRQLIAEGKLAPQQALAIVPQICEALQFAHEEGIVHRDVKPENILVDKRGRVKIADFGLAKLLRVQPTDVTLTQARQIMGTWHYMAPEQIEHPQEVDHRADIYSLGVVFYEMLTGQLPLGRFEPPSKRAQVDARLDDVVLRALEREPERRYQFASEVKTDVESISAAPGFAAPRTRSERQDATERTAALDRVRNPAIGLFVTGIAYWAMIPLAFVLLASRALWMDDLRDGLWWSFLMQPALAGAVLIFAGAKMKRLEAYGFVVFAAIVPILILLGNVAQLLVLRSFGFSPGDLVGPAMGLWALVVLTSPEVKQAFMGSRQHALRPEPSQMERERNEAATVVVCAMLALLGLTAFGMWVTQSAWVLAALFLPWVVPGIAAALDKSGSKETPPAANVGLVLAPAITLGLIAYGIWITKSAWPLLALAVPFAAAGVGYGMGSEQEEETEAAGEGAEKKGAPEDAEAEEEDESGWGCFVWIILFFIIGPVLTFVAGAVSDVNGYLIDVLQLDQRLERPLLIVLWGVLIAGLALAAHQIWMIFEDDGTPGETVGRADAAARDRLRWRIGRAGIPVLMLLALVLLSLRREKPGDKAPTTEPAPNIGAPAAQLLKAAGEGDVSGIKTLWQDYADMNAVDPQTGETALMKAAANGHTAAAVILMLRRANEQARDREGKTPLMHAAASGQSELVQLLVDINRVSWDEEMQFRVTRLDTELPRDTDFKALHFDVAAEAHDREGETALMKAAARGDLESVRALLSAASNEEARDRRGRTALMHALAGGQTAFLQTMIDRAEARLPPPGYTVTGFVTPEVLCALDDNGKTALEFAREQGHTQIAAGLQAYLEHVIESETRGIEADSPYAGYCYQVRGQARKALGQTAEAEADLAKARELSKSGP